MKLFKHGGNPLVVGKLHPFWCCRGFLICLGMFVKVNISPIKIEMICLSIYRISHIETNAKTSKLDCTFCMTFGWLFLHFINTVSGFISDNGFYEQSICFYGCDKNFTLLNFEGWIFFIWQWHISRNCRLQCKIHSLFCI